MVMTVINELWLYIQTSVDYFSVNMALTKVR